MVWGLSLITGTLTGEEGTQRHREGHVVMEAENGVMCLQVKELKACQGHQKLGRGTEGFFPRAFRGRLALLTA